jgi:Shikimate 5-dehydrogenase
MNLDDMRVKIDSIDDEIKQLFIERMNIVAQVSEFKRKNGTAVLDKNRESAIISRVTQNENPDTADQLRSLFSAMFEISRSYQIKQLTFDYGLIGHPLSHSYSGKIHQIIDKYRYDLIDLNADDFDIFMKRREFNGINVTIPYKQSVIKYCDELSDTAKRIGSVNTIYKRDGKLYGDNTDYKGFEYMLTVGDITLKDKKVIILGSGGTSLTAQAVAYDYKASEITVISRSGINNYDNLHLHKNAEVIINTTPVGMYPNCGLYMVNLDDFPNCEAVIDVIYNPLKTKLLLDAEHRGIQFINGLPMLSAQAVYAAELFTNESLHADLIEKIHNTLVNDMGNIVFIGMPGSGKTTIGKAIANEIGREFVDTDAWIENNENMSVLDIITTKGESVFREIEHKAVTELGKQSGLVIATGGGVVLREDNIDMLRQNGRLIWIKRPIEQLDTAGRPLSVNLNEMYEKREPLYRKYCDYTIEN